MNINGSTYSNYYSLNPSQLDINISEVTPPAALTGFTYSVFNSAEDLAGVLNMIASDNDFSVLSSPQVMVLNNETATINVGDQIPIATSQTVSDDVNVNEVRTIQYKDTGVILTVTPRINYNGVIILDIDQQVSEASLNALNETEISNRQIKTKLAVKDSQAILMGGLISKKIENGESGVPILKDIPLLGWFFKYQFESVRNTELLVMITPYVIESENVLDQYLRKFQEKTNELRNELNRKSKIEDAPDSN